MITELPMMPLRLSMDLSKSGYDIYDAIVAAFLNGHAFSHIIVRGNCEGYDIDLSSDVSRLMKTFDAVICHQKARHACAWDHVNGIIYDPNGASWESADPLNNPIGVVNEVLIYTGHVNNMSCE
jgi:hypothetical protein